MPKAHLIVGKFRICNLVELYDSICHHFSIVDFDRFLGVKMFFLETGDEWAYPNSTEKYAPLPQHVSPLYSGGTTSAPSR